MNARAQVAFAAPLMREIRALMRGRAAAPRSGDGYTELYLERGKDVLAADEKRPVLYDAHNRPLTRPTGFRPDKGGSNDA